MFLARPILRRLFVPLVIPQGRPFMESLKDNKALLYTLMMSSGLVIVLCLGLSPSFSHSFDIVEFDVKVSFARSL